MEMKARKASNEQKSYLIEYMENNIEFANDRFQSVDGVHLSAQKWGDLAATLNSLGGAVKDAAKWRKYWSDQKSHAREREVLRRSTLEKSGRNGLGRLKEASDFEKRVLQLMAPVVITENDNVREMLNVTQPEMELEFIESESEAINTGQVLPLEEPQTPLPLPRPPSPPHRSSSIRKRKTGLNSFEGEYLEIEQKKLKLMEENNMLLKEKNELEKEKLRAEIEWRNKKYELELRRIKIMEMQTTSLCN